MMNELDNRDMNAF